MKENKTTNNDLHVQNTTQKTEDQATRTPLSTRDKCRCSGRVRFLPTSGTHRVSLVTNLVIIHEKGKGQEVLTTSGTGAGQ
jgi:hypothetical protein